MALDKEWLVIGGICFFHDLFFDTKKDMWCLLRNVMGLGWGHDWTHWMTVYMVDAKRGGSRHDGEKTFCLEARKNQVCASG